MPALGRGARPFRTESVVRRRLGGGGHRLVIDGAGSGLYGAWPDSRLATASVRSSCRCGKCAACDPALRLVARREAKVRRRARGGTDSEGIHPKRLRPARALRVRRQVSGEAPVGPMFVGWQNAGKGGQTARVGRSASCSPWRPSPHTDLESRSPSIAWRADRTASH